jgi:hypothetical protein
MGKLLIDGEPPLIVQASLALKIGFNEAMVLQQVHYWMQHSTTTAYGHRWVYNTMEEWNAQFPFWSKDTVRRTIASLKERGLLVAECLSNNRFDRTPYYRISAETLESIVGCKLQSTADTVDGNLQSSTAQNAIDVDANLPSSDDCNLQCSDDGNLQSTLDSTETTKDYSETTAPGPEVVVVENSVAPQAASASNGIQVGLFSAEPAKPEPGQVALALPAAEPADDGDGDAPDDRPAGVSDDEWKIFDYWRDKTGHTRAKLGPKLRPDAVQPGR